MSNYQFDTAIIYIDWDEENPGSYLGTGVSLDGMQHFHYFNSGNPEEDFKITCEVAQEKAQWVGISSSVDTFVMQKENDQYI